MTRFLKAERQRPHNGFYRKIPPHYYGIGFDSSSNCFTGTVYSTIGNYLDCSAEGVNSQEFNPWIFFVSKFFIYKFLHSAIHVNSVIFITMHSILRCLNLEKETRSHIRQFAGTLANFMFIFIKKIKGKS